MKKLIAFAVVFALIAGVAAFADDGKVNEGITISGSAGATFVPFILGGPKYTGFGGITPDYKVGSWKNEGGWTYVPVQDDTGGSVIYTGVFGYSVKVNVSGSTDYAGFGLKLNQDGVDSASFWVQPLGSPLLKFAFDGSLAISSNDLVPGLSLSLKLPDITNNEDYGNTAGEFFAHAWRKVQVSAGYKIPDIASFSVGYNGGWAEKIDLKNPSDLQLRYIYNGELPDYATEAIWDVFKGDPNTDDDGVGAFVDYLPYGDANFTANVSVLALKSIGLGIDLGAKFYLLQSVTFSDPSSTDITITRENLGGVDLSLGVDYENGDFSVGFGFKANKLGRSQILTYAGDDLPAPYTKGKGTLVEPVEMEINVGPRYKIDGTTIGLDVKAAFTSESRAKFDGDDATDDLLKDSTAKYTFGAFVAFKPFGNATLKVGINVETPKIWTANGANVAYGASLDPSVDGGPANTAPIPQKDTRFFISVPITFGVTF
jgi:hypothetical protein